MFESHTPEPIKKFADVLSRLPGLGPRQALRLAYYLASEERPLLAELQHAAESLGRTRLCAECFYTHTERGSLCRICADAARNKACIAVVEKPTDLLSLEKTKKHKGRYLVLGDLQKTGVMEPEQALRIAALKAHIAKVCGGKAEEIILAISPTAYGDLNASMLLKELSPHTKKITRLGRGLPTGGEIEFADEETLASAIEGRSSH